MQAYFKWKYFWECILPFVILAAIVLLWLILWLISKIGDAWEKWQQKRYKQDEE